MARISIESIREELAQVGWTLISTEYKNLDTELVMECDQKHRVYAPWKKLRGKIECPVCAETIKSLEARDVLPKPKGEKRVLAVDQATYISGYAIFDGGRLVRYGTFETRLEDEAARINTFKNWLISMVNNWKPDIVGVEGIQYEPVFGVTTFETLARLQGVVIDTLFTLGISYKICPTNTWRAHNHVKGRTRADKKQSMKHIVEQDWHVKVTDDCADAIGIGRYVAETLPKKPVIESWE